MEGKRRIPDFIFVRWKFEKIFKFRTKRMKIARRVLFEQSRSECSVNNFLISFYWIIDLIVREPRAVLKHRTILRTSYTPVTIIFSRFLYVLISSCNDNLNLDRRYPHHLVSLTLFDLSNGQDRYIKLLLRERRIINI